MIAHAYAILSHLFTNGTGESVFVYVLAAGLLVALYGIGRHNDRAAMLRRGNAFPDAAGPSPGLPGDDEDVAVTRPHMVIHLGPPDHTRPG